MNEKHSWPPSGSGSGSGSETQLPAGLFFRLTGMLLSKKDGSQRPISRPVKD